MRKQKCIITISSGDEDDTVTTKIKWIPELDMKDDSKNHPAVVDVAFTMLEALGKIIQEKVSKND